jgi:hypothetical protein
MTARGFLGRLTTLRTNTRLFMRCVNVGLILVALVLLAESFQRSEGEVEFRGQNCNDVRSAGLPARGALYRRQTGTRALPYKVCKFIQDSG